MAWTFLNFLAHCVSMAVNICRYKTCFQKCHFLKISKLLASFICTFKSVTFEKCQFFMENPTLSMIFKIFFQKWHFWKLHSFCICRKVQNHIYFSANLNMDNELFPRPYSIPDVINANSSLIENALFSLSLWLQMITIIYLDSKLAA